MKRTLFFLISILLLGNLSGCDEYVSFDDVDEESTEYWCYVSGGSWILPKNTDAQNTDNPPTGYCQCDGVQCGAGIVCMDIDNKLQCASMLSKEEGLRPTEN